MMKAGTETGSLINHLYSRISSDPVIGLGATILGWTDRHPGTVSEVFKKGAYEYVGIRSDKYKRIDDKGMSDAQDYEYSEDPDGTVTYFRRKIGGKWAATYFDKETNRWKNRQSGSGLVIGVRERYYDFSF